MQTAVLVDSYAGVASWLSSTRVATPTVTCRNCGAAAGPQFCGTCGQAIADRRSPLLALVAELFEETLSLDGRTARTLRTLVHPGRLTQLYLDGKRAPFLTPLRLYLLASLVLFSSAFALEPLDARTVNFYVAGHLITESPPVRGRPNLTFMNRDSLIEQWLSNAYAEHFARLRAKPPQDAINVLFRGMRSVMPVAMIAFLPLFALALKLLYIRRHVLYVDHLVFAAHLQSAVFFTLGAGWLISRVLQLSLTLTMLLQVVGSLLMLTIYLGKGLRRLYGESRSMTAAKTFIMIYGYMFSVQSALSPALLFVISQI